MFHDQARAELEERLTRAVDEFIQDGPPGGVSDRAIDVHVPGLRKCSLACQGLMIRKQGLACQLRGGTRDDVLRRHRERPASREDV